MLTGVHLGHIINRLNENLPSLKFNRNYLLSSPEIGLLRTRSAARPYPARRDECCGCVHASRLAGYGRAADRVRSSPYFRC